MIRQHINLIDALPIGKRDQYNFTVQKFFYLNVAFNVLLLLTVSYTFVQWRIMDHKKMILANELSIQDKILSNMKVGFPTFFFDKEANSTNKIEKSIFSGKEMLGRLNPATPFSTIFLNLSKNIVSQVWLTNIVLSNNGSEIILNGKSYSEKQLEQFIHNLSQDNDLKKYTLKVSKLERIFDKKQAVTLDFELKLGEKTVS